MFPRLCCGDGERQSRLLAQSVFFPQQPRKKSPLASCMTERYCPGHIGGGLLARGYISHAGRLGKLGGGGLCAQPVSRLSKTNAIERSMMRATLTHPKITATSHHYRDGSGSLGIWPCFGTSVNIAQAGGVIEPGSGIRTWRRVFSAAEEARHVHLQSIDCRPRRGDGLSPEGRCRRAAQGAGICRTMSAPRALENCR